METHESAVVDHLAGKSFAETARNIGYDPRTVARWVMRIIEQAVSLGPKIIARVLKELANSTLPLLPAGNRENLEVALAWLREFTGLINFNRINRLIGLANLLGQGQWNLWGGELGSAKPRPG
ncbi:MAG: helix-turn-helix domain-containing protein [Bacillota bacterium]